MVNKRFSRLTRACIVFITIVLLSSSCSPKEMKVYRRDAFVLGTRGMIQVNSTNEKKANEAINRAFKRVQEIESLMSTSLEGSDVYNINRNAGKSSVKVSPETIKVIQAGIEYKELTRGAFNIVLGSLIELWGIGKPWQKVPTRLEINEALRHIDIHQLEIDEAEKKVFLRNPNMLMDLGGIAKGFAVDEAVKSLRSSGINSGIVELGGDLFALGKKTNGDPWFIAVQNPIIGEVSAVGRIPLVDKSIVTSGDYERYFIEEGIHYHHILDPRTGYPARSELVSVTIISDTAIEGDILSTAVFVMGLEEGLRLIEELPGIEAILITRNREIYLSSGVKNQFEIMDRSFTIVN